MSQNSSRRQKAAKWAGEASLFAANQYFQQKQQQGETSPETEEKPDLNLAETPPETEEKLAQTASETPQDKEKKPDRAVSEILEEIKEKPEQKSRRQKLGKWGKQVSLFAASEYLRRNDQQVSEQQKLTPMETFLGILQTAAFGISVLAAILLFLLIRFGLGQY